jgi:hypothetical protein
MFQNLNIWERQWEIEISVRNEIKSVLNSGSGCYRAVRDVLSSPLLFKA